MRQRIGLFNCPVMSSLVHQQRNASGGAEGGAEGGGAEGGHAGAGGVGGGGGRRAGTLTHA